MTTSLRHFIVLTLIALFLLHCIISSECTTEVKSLYEVHEIASGFTWAENLICDRFGNMFVSDVFRGELWRIYYNETSELYIKKPHIRPDGHFDRFLGLAVLSTSASSDTLFAVARERQGTDASVILQMGTQIPDQWKIIARLPKLANGLALHVRSGLVCFALVAMMIVIF